MSVLTERRGRVLVITLDRPEARNAVDRPTAELLADALRAFEGDDGLSVAVLTGAHGTFCAGADLKAMEDPARRNRLESDMAADGPMGPTRMEIDKPVIAAIEGYAVAGGLELACWCDLRVAGDDAVLGVFCRRWGVPLIDGGTVRLPRIVGLGRALDLILTGRPVDAHEAHAMGLVNRVVASGGALAAAVELAELIASFPQECMRADRRSVIGSFDGSFGDAMEREFLGGVSAVMAGGLDGARRFTDGAGRGGSWTPGQDE